MAARGVLVVQHEDSCPPGWLGERWAATGLDLDVRRPYRPEADEQLPESLDEHTALVVLGGEMGANDDADFAWLPQVKSLLQQALSRDVPTLGVCLGHQLLAVAAGGEVQRNPHGHATGVTPIRLTGEGAGDPLLDDLDRRPVVQWNDDVVVRLPAAATLLAEAPDGSPQAIRVGPRAWGVQFHPEAGPQIFDGWTVDKPSANLPRADGIDVAAAADDVRAAEGELRALGDLLADRFAAIVGAPLARQGS